MHCIHPIDIYDRKFNKHTFVPCGRCMPCRINKTQSWVLRLELEKTNVEKSAFVTLTYDDEHLPKDCSLHKRDVQLFFKRLRKAELQFRYYCVGEYGETELKYYDPNYEDLIELGKIKPHGRPHYHILFFGVNFRDDDDFEILKKSWFMCSNDYWEIHRNKLVGNLDCGSIRYTCDYMQKKQYGLNSLIEYLDCVPPFSLCSQKLGLEQFEKDLDTYRKNGFIVYNGHKCPIPRYFRDKFDIPVTINPENSPYRELCLKNGFVSSKDLESLDYLSKKNRRDEYFYIIMLNHPNHLEEVDKVIKRRNNLFHGSIL